MSTGIIKPLLTTGDDGVVRYQPQRSSTARIQLTEANGRCDHSVARQRGVHGHDVVDFDRSCGLEGGTRVSDNRKEVRARPTDHNGTLGLVKL